MAQSIENTLLAKAEALAYGATPVEFSLTTRTLEALGTDYADPGNTSTANQTDPIATLQLHAALMQGRLTWARYNKDQARRTEEKIAAIPPGDPFGALPALQAQLATYKARAMTAYGQLLFGLGYAEQFDFYPAISG